MNIENEIAKKFNFNGKVQSVTSYGMGHINSTFLVQTKGAGRYILQRVNGNVFKNPKQVMHNIIAVTEYLRPRMTEKMQTLTLVPCQNGQLFFTAPNGEIWRAYRFVENTVSLELPETERDFFESAVAFGSFQKMLKDFPVEQLYETIENFHNTPVRFKNFLAAVTANPLDRAKSAAPEIDFVKARADFCSTLEESHKAGLLPLKVTHNDTKLNNILLDAKTREPVCIIDLDTIMPGYSVNDFGDSIRFGASTAAEDEKDLSKVHLSLKLFEVYARGFLKGCAGTLTPGEKALLPVGAKIMTLECGMRFLTDYLLGDTYFKTDYPEHNLVRCRTQFKLVEEIEKHWAQMQQIVAAL